MGRIARALAVLWVMMAGAALAQQGPAEVGVVTLTPREVPFIETLPGRAEAFQTADIRPRVGGVIAEVFYDPGQPVRAGDLLFRIEDDTYSASLQAAQAEVKRADAAVTAARSALTRARSLAGTASTRVTIENAEVALAQAEAQFSAAQAQEKLAQLDLDETQIRSPIDGVPDIAQVTIGSVVTANQAAALTTVRRLDPIFVDVQQSSAAILRRDERVRQGSLTLADRLEVDLTLEDGSTYSRHGRMVTPGSSVSTTTGTTRERFQFDNPERRILPGQFLRVQVTVGTTRALLVPQRATSRAADGTLTVFLARDGRAVQVTLTEAGTADNAWIVTDGAQAGDQVIVDGLQDLRNGAEVTPVPVTISADGVVNDGAVAQAGG
ncbi:MAG: efflux RND transporter periplasmic adaptor subunit [Paracoccus sp. (in: a-proteobacteria)]|uniref:efflux RND transporter periplasmic adaptor subunit n=1 Tax=Paracoccus sp. TaxID=267 RepID=UPI0026E040A5|nr:efflux RND transporter periplasmic adaptor subunit [Paracoccus sp. (in: a-proteobacteria)]MDO5620325.1 efflux RND transporter periplasmic adaptor subunit [Paracoccus sp. (in: a-proteobacteria)]